MRSHRRVAVAVAFQGEAAFLGEACHQDGAGRKRDLADLIHEDRREFEAENFFGAFLLVDTGKPDLGTIRESEMDEAGRLFAAGWLIEAIMMTQSETPPALTGGVFHISEAFPLSEYFTCVGLPANPRPQLEHLRYQK